MSTSATPLFDLKGKRVYVAGHRGMVGGAIVRRLASEHCMILIEDRQSLDLTRQAETERWLERMKPDVVVVAAARVGGIAYNNAYPVDFLADNLAIELNLIRGSHAAGVRKLLFLGSSCIYPKLAPQPIPESALLTGPLEPTNDAYAIAKIAGLLHVQAMRRQHGHRWISAMPTNLYGPGDNFSPTGSHVLPALIRRYDEAVASGADQVTNWGSGKPRREFLHVDDMAAACLHLLEHYDGPGQVNVGTGRDATIAEIAQLVAEAVGFHGETVWDTSKPDGTPQKLLDVSTIEATGWMASIGLAEGIAGTVEWFREHVGDLREAG
jgi:GDP-L-fucose synthase